MKRHQHRPVASLSRTRPYSGSVDARTPNPAAHGGVCHVHTCRCGAERRVNANGQHREVGRWHPLTSDAADA